MDANNKERSSVKDYVNSEYANLDFTSYGIDPDLALYSFDNEDDKFVEPLCFTEAKAKVMSQLNREFDPLEDDNNFGIDVYFRVRERIAEIL